MPEHQLHHSGLDIVSTRTDTRRLGGSCEGTSVPRPTGLVAARVGNSQRGFLWVSSGYRRAPLSRFERGRIMRSLCSASLQHLDGVIDVALLKVKYFHQYLEREAFKKLPKGMTLAAGIVDENRARVRNRIADWARVVCEDRLWVAPSCGFGRHPARNAPVLRAKIEHMVEAARTL